MIDRLAERAQRALAEAREKVKRTQSALAAHAGDFGELQILIRNNLAATLRQLALTVLPALAGSLPMLFVLPWLSNRFDYVAPAPGEEVRICATPASAVAKIQSGAHQFATIGSDGCASVPSSSETVSLIDAAAVNLYTLPQSIQTPVVARFSLFNALVGNPAGYLPDTSPLEAVEISLRKFDVIDVGPDWMRRWEFPYFEVLIGISIFLKLRWRIL